MARHQPHLLVSVPERGDVVQVDDLTRHHLEKVLRVASAVPVTYTDGNGMYGSGLYTDGAISRGEEDHRPRFAELAVAVAPPRDNSRLRFLVEKLAELGVAELVWLDTAHREGRPPRPEKTSRWIRSAVEQSRGAWLMGVRGPIGISDVAALGTLVFAQAGGGRIGDLPQDCRDLVLCVGPEGGFAPDEVPATAFRLGLGDNILRVETAAVAGVALLRNALN